MNPIKSILVVLDRSDRDEHVCAKAVALARQLNARLELFLCDSEHELAFKHNYDTRAVAGGRNACVVGAIQYLNAVRDRLPFEASRIRTSASCDSPLYDGICRKVAEAKRDLVLKSPDCHHPGQRLSFSDNDWLLASACPVPVMFVRGRQWGEAPHIGAAIDVSSEQEAALAREIAAVASQLQSHTRGHLEILSCALNGGHRSERDTLSRRLDEALSQLPAISKDCVQLLEGEPDIVLPRFSAARHYDVLVMGALAHRSGVAPVVGSLTGKLIGELDCDFILVKAEPTASLHPLQPTPSWSSTGRTRNAG